MQDLLPYYERELALLRQYGKEFAERYPKIAGRLLLSDEDAQDPHVETLIESFALLGARISKRLDDDYPELTDALLEAMYPHFLRPFPSCSIARFDMGPGLSKLSAPTRIPKGSMLQSRKVRGIACRFRTAFDVELAPLAVDQVRYDPVTHAPMATRLPAGSGGCLSLRVRLMSDQLSFDEAGSGVVRLFVNGEPSMVAALRDALALHVAKAFVEHDDDGRWKALDASPLTAAGFDDSDALIEFSERSNQAYRLLTEFFAFPDKFNFFDLATADLVAGAARSFTLHLVMRSTQDANGIWRTLENVGKDNLLTGCTPVVNLFRQHGEPIRLDERTVSYPVVADARRAYAYDVHAIESVHRIRQTPQGEEIQRYRPFFSLQHGETIDATEQYWIARRDELVEQHSPGHETELTFVDARFDVTRPKTDVISLELTCSNRDLPSHLAVGVTGGDLSMEGSSAVRSIALLRKPTRPRRFKRGKAAQWRLVSHLALNHFSIVNSGLEAFREMLALYDLHGAGVTRQQIEGVVGIDAEPVSAWLPGQHFPSVVRGLEIRLTVDESNYVGTGISAFVEVLDRFFGMYVHANSFTRLVVLSSRDGEEIVRCKPRSGASILV